MNSSGDVARRIRAKYLPVYLREEFAQSIPPENLREVFAQRVLPVNLREEFAQRIRPGICRKEVSKRTRAIETNSHEEYVQ
jgi:hypothetical protein